MKSGIYFNKLSLQMFEVLVIENYALVTMFENGEEHKAFVATKELLETGTNIEYLGEL